MKKLISVLMVLILLLTACSSHSEPIEQQKIKKIIRYIGDTDQEPEDIDLVESARKYLLRFNMTEKEIQVLQKRLMQ
mgnify:CR=1 FL=1